MERKSVGKLTEQERDEIQHLNYRRQTLKTLFRSFAEEENEINPGLYDKLIEDMTQTEQRYDTWFRQEAQQHGWDRADGASWSVDFESCEVFLVE